MIHLTLLHSVLSAIGLNYSYSVLSAIGLNYQYIEKNDRPGPNLINVDIICQT